MAFCGKLGRLIHQQSGSSSSMLPVMLNSVRHMASTKLYIGGLSSGTDDQSLMEAFNSFGNIVEAKVITKKDTGRSRGFGFVDFDSAESASAALSGMDGQLLHGRNIRVSHANGRPTDGFQGGFGGGGGSGLGAVEATGLGAVEATAIQDDFGGDSGKGF